MVVVTLTKIYSLLREYQTLTREIATPTVPSFADVCLQMIKPSVSGRPARLPTTLIEAVVDALATLVPLYPSTLRPLSNQIRETIRGFIAPTSSDGTVVPHTLSRASRRLLLSLHHTAPKDGSSDEWAKVTHGLIRDCHATADQVFRSVQEHWESDVGYHSQGTIDHGGDPRGGGKALDEFPPWTDLLSGSERLIGLLEVLGDCFRYPTRSSVSMPLAAVVDITSRISLLMPPSSGQDDRHQANPAIGRDERDQLWGALPDIHLAAMRLLLSILQRLSRNVLPFAHEMVDQIVRMFSSTRHVSSARENLFLLARELLLAVGSDLDKTAAGLLSPVIQACCRDLLDASGYAQDTKRDEAVRVNGTKATKGKASIGNADTFLNPQPKSSTAATGISSNHRAAIQALLPLFFSHLPQRHVSPDMRALIDRTAILGQNKAAMLASCLYPYKDASGRFYPSVLPFLARQFPDDQEVEVFRSNLRDSSSARREIWDPQSRLETLLEEPTVEAPLQADPDLEEQVKPDSTVDRASEIVIPSFTPHVPTASKTAAEENPFMSQVSIEPGAPAAAVEQMPSPRKRKGEDLESGAPKKLEKTDGADTLQRATAVQTAASASDDEDDSDEEGSIQIDMTMDDEEDEEEDEE